MSQRIANALQAAGALGFGLALYLIDPVVLLAVGSLTLIGVGVVLERR